MNIAFFASSFYPNMGGVEEMCRQLAHACQNRGHQVRVWTEQWPRTLPEFESYEDIPVHRFPMRIPIRDWKAKLSYALTSRLIAARIVRSVQEWKIDVLHVQCVSSAAWYALHVKSKLNIPLVVTLHGELYMDATQVFQHSKIHQRIMRTALREADAITACSRQTLHEAEEFYGQLFGPRAQVIHNGVNLQEFERPEPYSHPRPYILAIGRQVQEKGFDVLLRAFARAGDLGHDLILAGYGTERAELQALANRLDLSGKVHFPGWASHSDAIRLFKGCSFFVLPSRQEPFGIVNLEAMAAGKAIIASRVGGVPEVLEDKKTALLVPAGNDEALARALQRLATDGALRTQLSQAAKCRVRAFEWDEVAQQHLQLYSVLRTMRDRDVALQGPSIKFS